MSTPAISVIMPVYNTERFVAQTTESVLAFVAVGATALAKSFLLLEEFVGDFAKRGHRR